MQSGTLPSFIMVTMTAALGLRRDSFRSDEHAQHVRQAQQLTRSENPVHCAAEARPIGGRTYSACSRRLIVEQGFGSSCAMRALSGPQPERPRSTRLSLLHLRPNDPPPGAAQSIFRTKRGVVDNGDSLFQAQRQRSGTITHARTSADRGHDALPRVTPQWIDAGQVYACASSGLHGLCSWCRSDEPHFEWIASVTA